MNRGYIKIWRKIEDSGLLQLPNTMTLFMYLLLRATYQDRKIGTPLGVVELKRGQFISGRHKLAQALDQSEQQIRTGLERLEMLGIISIIATSKYSIYIIENYNNYQDEQIQSTSQQPANNQQITSKQPTDNQQITTKQEGKKEKKEKKVRNILEENEIFPEILDRQIVRDWMEIRKSKVAPNTKTALVGIEREAKKANLQIEDAIRVCCERGWAGFKAEWYLIDKASKSKNDAWWNSEASILSKGSELNLYPKPGESMQNFKGRINQKMENN